MQDICPENTSEQPAASQSCSPPVQELSQQLQEVGVHTYSPSKMVQGCTHSLPGPSVYKLHDVSVENGALRIHRKVPILGNRDSVILFFAHLRLLLQDSKNQSTRNKITPLGVH